MAPTAAARHPLTSSPRTPDTLPTKDPEHKARKSAHTEKISEISVRHAEVRIWEAYLVDPHPARGGPHLQAGERADADVDAVRDGTPVHTRVGPHETAGVRVLVGVLRQVRMSVLSPTSSNAEAWRI